MVVCETAVSKSEPAAKVLFSVVKLLVDAGLGQPKGDARRTIQGGGVYLNSQRIEEAGQMVTINDAFEGQFLVLRKGRKKYHLVKILS